MSRNDSKRTGAIAMAFAVMLPVLLIMAAMAINLAHIQLTQTQMKIAVDSAVHAGGRRLGTPQLDENGLPQDLDDTKADVRAFAARIAAMNSVAGGPAIIPNEDMEFGRSDRELDGDTPVGAFRFKPIESGQIPSSFRIDARNTPVRLPFGPISPLGGHGPRKYYTPTAISVSTQVDRDVVLVLDRSGSMIYFEDEDGLRAKLDELKDATYTKGEEEVLEYRVQYTRTGWVNWYNSGVFSYATQEEFDSGAISNPPYIYRLNEFNSRVRTPATLEVKRKLLKDGVDGEADGALDEYADATKGLYDRWYSNNVVYWLERDYNDEGHTLGDDPETWAEDLTVAQARAKLTVRDAIYAYDYSTRYRSNDKSISVDNHGWNTQIDTRRAPAYSRWYHLERGVNQFLNVLGGGPDIDGEIGTDGIVKSQDGTVQKEQVAILPFNSSPDTIDYTADSKYLEGRYKDQNSGFDYDLQEDGFPAAFVNANGAAGYDEPHPGSFISQREILPTICPYGGTAIGDSLREALITIRNRTDDDTTARARPSASKTIVVLTDGNNSSGDKPEDVARDELANEDVIVHTITFTEGVSQAGKDAMEDVAEYGKGTHYHTDDSSKLTEIFEQIANNLPTILTQ